MPLPARKYVRLTQAAQMLSCTIEDIVHWAANDQTKIGIPYVSDGFNPPYVYDPDNLDSQLEDYYGFAFILSEYLIEAEVTGVCGFISLSLPDGRVIMFPPAAPENVEYSDAHPIEFIKYAKGLPLHALFIRAEELAELAQPEKNHQDKVPLPTDREHISRNLAYLNQAAHKFWANADRSDRTTHPENKDVAAWLIKCGYSTTLAEKAATIIRPEWAITGRKPDK